MREGLSYLLTEELALRCIHLVLDNLFSKLVEDGTVKRPDLCVVVFDPVKVFGSQTTYEELACDPMNMMIGGSNPTRTVFRPYCAVEELIVAEVALGDETKWEHDFRQLARHKAHQARKYRMPNQYIVEQAPWLLAADEPPFFGSAYCDGLVVGVSGVQSWYDQMIAEMVASAIKAHCFDAMRKPDGILDGEGATMAQRATRGEKDTL
jgi:hypothetical protein